MPGSTKLSGSRTRDPLVEGVGGIRRGVLLRLALVDTGFSQGAQSSVRGAAAHLVQAGFSHCNFGLTKADPAGLMSGSCASDRREGCKALAE
jgi:hypothetical protein